MHGLILAYVELRIDPSMIETCSLKTNHPSPLSKQSLIACSLLSNVESDNLEKHALKLGASRHVWLGQLDGIPFIPINMVTV